MIVQVDMGNLSKVSQHDKRLVTEGQHVGTKLHKVPLRVAQRGGRAEALTGSRRHGGDNAVSAGVGAGAVTIVALATLVALSASAGCTGTDTNNATVIAANQQATQEQNVMDCMNDYHPTLGHTWTTDYLAKIGQQCNQFRTESNGADVCIYYYACGGK
jgi:hypothetical protein